MPIVKTAAGQQVLKDRSVPLTPRQRAAFILFDGQRSLEEVLAATAGSGVTRSDIDRLLELGLIAAVPARGQRPAPAAEAMPAAAAAPGAGTPQERYAAAYPLAIALTSALGLRGFRLNLAVEAARSFEDLVAVAPRIRDAVGPERFAPLDEVLGGI